MTTNEPATRTRLDSGHRHDGWALALICIAQLMVVLDATIANIEARTGKDGAAALAAMTPLGRLIEPEEVAFAVRFFAADEAGAINGETLLMGAP